ncbi:MAG: S41 family peptidase [bacterium]|nr:S41 family peptidase [bacterium]
MKQDFRLHSVIVCGMLVVVVPWLMGAAPSYERIEESHLSSLASACLQWHVSKRALTPELAAATLSNFVDILDYGRVVLRQEDVDGIHALRATFPQAYANGDWHFITNVYAMFLERIDEQLDYARGYLTNAGFTLDMGREIVVDAKKRRFANSGEEWRRGIEDALQYQVAYLVAIGEPLSNAVDKVLKRRERQARRFHEMKHEQRLGLFVNAWCMALDPHTAYLSYDDVEDFNINMNLSLEGIGAMLQEEDGVTVIKGLTPGGPAERSGLVKPGDKIFAVAQGDEGEYVDIYDMDLREVVKLIRGKKGTVVRLKIVRTGPQGPTRLDVRLVRERVKLEDQAARMEIVSTVRTNLAGEVQVVRVGVIDLPSFYADQNERGLLRRKSTRSAVADVRRWLQACVTAGVDGVVLDLQRNGGGLLEEAVDVAGLFLRRGNIVLAADRRGVVNVLADTDGSIYYEGPLIVTVSRVTASGAEIVAGALQDYQRALIVGGDHTFGKGTIQQVLPLPGKLGALKITVGEYFIASGRSPQHAGIRSDIVVPSELSAYEIGEQYQASALPARTVPSQLSGRTRTGAVPGGWDPVSSEEIARLALRSRERVEASSAFQRVCESVKKILADREKGAVSIASLLAAANTNIGPVELDRAEEEPMETRQALTNDLVVMEAVEIMGDWVTGAGLVPEIKVIAHGVLGTTNTLCTDGAEGDGQEGLSTGRWARGCSEVTNEVSETVRAK